MSAKKNKKQWQEVLTWQEFKAWRRDFVGGTVEIFRDCSFENMLHQFIRGTVVSISWRKGKPDVIRFREGTECLARESGLRPWGKSNWNVFHCQQGRPPIPLPKGAVDPRRENAWTKNRVISFVTADHTDVALYPKGVVINKTPFFYKSARQIEMFINRPMTKVTLRKLKEAAQEKKRAAV